MPPTLVRRLLQITLLTMQCQWVEAAFAPEDELRFTHLMEEAIVDDVNIHGVNAISTDAQGRMWFGGEAGLVRFDGHEYQPMHTLANDPTSLSNQTVLDLFLDREQVLWVATQQGLNRFNPAQDNFIRYFHDKATRANDRFSSLTEDPEGNLWLGNAQGLDKLDSKRENLQPQPEFAHMDVRKVLAGQDGILWVGTLDRGLAKFNTRTREIRWYRHDPQQAHSLPADDVRALSLDRQHRLWVGTFGGGAARLDAQAERFIRYHKDPTKFFHLGGNIVMDLHTDAAGNLWAATSPGGVSRYDPQLDQFIPSDREAGRPDSLASTKTRKIFSDPQGDLWVGLFPRGVDQLSLFAQHFHNYRGGTGYQGLSNSSVLSLWPSAGGDLWIGTEGGLNRFDPVNQHFSHYSPGGDNAQALQDDAVLALAPAEGDRLWVSVWGAGLYNFNPASQHFELIKPAPGQPFGLQTPFTWTLLKGGHDELLLGGEAGGLHQWLGGERFQTYFSDLDDPQSINANPLRALYQTQDGRIWVGGYAGLKEFIPERRTLVRHLRNSPEASALSRNIVGLFEDRDHQLWLCSEDAGATRYNTRSGETYNYGISNGLASNAVTSAQQDNAGFIWLSTGKGLARINPKDHSVINIDKNNGIVGNNFNRNASYKDSQGNLYFGGADGLTVFDPVAVFAELPLGPKVIIQRLRLHNQLATIGQPDSVLPQAIDQLDAITLNHHHSHITLEFFAQSFRAPQLNQYAYQLEGFDANWHQVGHNHTATYTNLPPGDYVFKVKAANSLGVWSDQPTQLRLHIKPAPWRSTAAWALYFLVFVGAVYYVFRQQQKRIALQHAQQLNTELRHLVKLKDAFIANTSHELRTPLNGIIGLADALQDGSQGEVTSGMRTSLQMIANSGRRLSLLINDILDFSKLSQQALQLNLQPVDLRAAIANAIDLTKPLAMEKSLTLIDTIAADAPRVLADAERLQQILLHLIGNAIKFTPAGSITLSSHVHAGMAIISVKDTGIGISQTDCAKLFVEFLQLDNSDTRAQGGTGLGLAICKQLVQLHTGELRVESTLGNGSTFYFSLPIALRPAALVENSKPLETPSAAQPTAPTEIPPKNISPPASPQTSVKQGTPLNTQQITHNRVSILVVDDDAINRMVLSSILKLHNYTVLEACGGQQALDILAAGTPVNLVILDVMMPGMNGYEAAMLMRVSYATNQLPIIFLTAKSLSDELVRGFVAGGNDFLTKPVAKNELLARVASHLALANHSAVAKIPTENSALLAQSKHQELQALNKIIEGLNREMVPENLVKLLLEQMRSLIPATQGISLWVLDSGNKTIRSLGLAKQHEAMPTNAITVNAPFIATLHQLTQNQLPVYALNTFINTPLHALFALFEQPNQTLITPLTFEEKVLGFVVLTHDLPADASCNTISTALNHIRAYAASVLLKAKLMQN